MSRKKRVLQALGLEDEFDELFGVKPKGRAPRAPSELPSENPFAVQLKRAAEQSRRALPAPPKPLALPAPGPGLPPQASKPRGGQFWTGKADAALSPDDVARKQAEEASYRFIDFVPEEGEGVLRMDAPQANVTQDWLARALAKYYKTDFGSPEDPLRDLAARGLHYDADMTPERWKATVDSYLIEDPIEQVLFPPNRMGGMPGAGSDMRGGALAAMPWLAKQPVTDKIYGISSGGLDIEHFADEFANALNPEISGLPMDLAVRPESLARMTFPQAVERVGRINQFRAKQMEEAAQSLADNPAVQTFKEYPDAGYRWVELRQPEPTMPEGAAVSKTPGWDTYEITDPRTGVILSRGATEDEALQLLDRENRIAALEEALKYEGDTMGHCVGGYCPNVMSGRSRIFSLRDAKGAPHVTVETSPGKSPWRASDIPRDVEAQLAAQADILAKEMMQSGYMTKEGASERAYNKLTSEWLSKQPTPAEDIIQIKGKQNRAPVDDYLPFVQDFVKGGTWGNVGDLGNTGLVRLPDGRIITQQQYDEARARAMSELLPGQVAMSRRHDGEVYADNWDNVAPYFEGFAIGGRVDADRCFSRHPMSVRKKK